MTRRLETFVCADPGAGARLGDEARTALADAAKGWRLSPPPAVLIEVRGDAWAHTCDSTSGLDDYAAITRANGVVTELYAVECPIVVAVEAAVSGLGAALLLATDVRFADRWASLAVGPDPTSALLGGIGWLAERDGVAAAFRRMFWTSAVLGVDEAVSGGCFTARGDGNDARDCAARLARNPDGWSAVKRARRSRARGDLGSVLRYEAWLADVALHP